MATQTTGIIDLIGAETYAAQVCEEAYVAADRANGSTSTRAIMGYEPMIARAKGRTPTTTA
jgi:hypothetical protein